MQGHLHLSALLPQVLVHSTVRKVLVADYDFPDVKRGLILIRMEREGGERKKEVYGESLGFTFPEIYFLPSMAPSFFPSFIC